jgi:hypothetical protein
MSDDEKVVSLTDRLKVKADEEAAFQRLLDAKSSAHSMLAPAVAEMRKLGLSSKEIAKTLRFVADVLDGKEI